MLREGDAVLFRHDPGGRYRLKGAEALVTFACPSVRRHSAAVSSNETIIDTPDGPMTWGEWKTKNPVQVPSRRSKGKDLPNKVRTRTSE